MVRCESGPHTEDIIAELYTILLADKLLRYILVCSFVLFVAHIIHWSASDESVYW